jgi:predicted RNase H-like HicB family nuclease
MNLTLSAVCEEVPESEGGGYVAYTEELPGAISEGDTLEEARKNLRNAIELLFLTRFVKQGSAATASYPSSE